MARISPATLKPSGQVADYMERWKKTKGYAPNAWLNRWNQTLATELEDTALAFTRKHLKNS